MDTGFGFLVGLVAGVCLVLLIRRESGNTVNLTVATNQEVSPPDPWKEIEIEDGEDGEDFWKNGKPNPLGPAG